jgi:hypothetical protein
MRQRTIKVWRIESDGRRLSACSIRTSSSADLAMRWQLFLATATRGVYVATYRGVQLGIALAGDGASSELAPLAA